MRFNHSTTRMFHPIVLVFAAVIAAAAVLIAASTLALSQTSSSISISLSPSNSVPMDMAITGRVTLNNLDPNEYSSVMFRADVNPYDSADSTEMRCNGDDTGADIEVEVDESREVLTGFRVFDACPNVYYSYGSYTLDMTLYEADETASDGRGDELATARTHFFMTRYLNGAAATVTPPSPQALAWMDPDPRTVGMTAEGEWRLFHFRSDVTRYHNDHLGRNAFRQRIRPLQLSRGSSSGTDRW